MKKKKTYRYHQKILSISKWLLSVVSVLLFIVLMAIKGGADLTSILRDPTFNAFYLLCMFDVICCLELWYFHRLLKENAAFESVMLSIVLLLVAQLFLMNLVMVVLFGLFLFKTLRSNGLQMKMVWKNARKNRALALPMANLTVCFISVAMIYVTVLYRFI